jgi:hypothetical protein
LEDAVGEGLFNAIQHNVGFGKKQTGALIKEGTVGAEAQGVLPALRAGFMIVRTQGLSSHNRLSVMFRPKQKYGSKRLQ